MTLMLSNTPSIPFSPGPGSPNFSEDLSRFPSESLHSFSFANQSEEFIHNRQNVLKRSVEFMKDRLGWSVPSQTAALASAEARVNGDVETQNMLDLLAKAHLVGAGNLPYTDQAITGPLTGPAEMSGENVFDKNFLPRAESPEPLTSPILSPSISPTRSRSLAPPEPEEGNEKAMDHAKQGRDVASKDASEGQESGNSTRSLTDESGTTNKTSPPLLHRPSLKRTLTDTLSVSVHQKLVDTMAQPFVAGQSGPQEQVMSPTSSHFFSAGTLPSALGPAVHGHSSRWTPAAQAIFTTESKPPWTIIAANDLACLVFGVTKAEVRKMGILEVVQEERRKWLERRLMQLDPQGATPSKNDVSPQSAVATVSSNLLGARSGGITAKLLSKPNSRSSLPRSSGRKAQTVHAGNADLPKMTGESVHENGGSRGVLLCGDVVPIQKRNGATGSASLWVKEKRVGLIWVLEEIHEDSAIVSMDEDGIIDKISGEIAPIWGSKQVEPGLDIGNLIPRIPRQGIDPRTGEVDFAQVTKRRFFTCPHSDKVNIPCTVEQIQGKSELRVSSLPHMAGIIVVNPATMNIKSSNSAFSGVLFGYEKADGLPINTLLPGFDKILQILIEDDGLQLHDGTVIPEHSFRKASTFLALREGKADVAASSFLRNEGLTAKHREGSDLKIDVQMRIVHSERRPEVIKETVFETSEDEGDSDEEEQEDSIIVPRSEMVYALWITFSRHLHVTKSHMTLASPTPSGAATPLHQPSPGQTTAHTPAEMSSDSDESKPQSGQDPRSSGASGGWGRQLKHAVNAASSKIKGGPTTSHKEERSAVPNVVEPEPQHKKTIDDFQILEDMGQGAYGQVKLARRKSNNQKVVLKYVTKRRILVDTWTRDRKLGTVPLEIHVLDYLRRPELKHPNIVEMEAFFEDDVNYYIEMVPHGLPGMDLFDYIELRSSMEEAECRSIFVQVAEAIYHLHTKALVVHRDIKDENVILDGEGRIKLIDFGSAAYIKNGPFDVFVGTIGE